MVCLVLALPLCAAIASLAVGHRNQVVVRGLAVGASAVSWVLALALGVEHWGRQSSAGYVIGERVQTGGIAIHPALAVDQLAATMLVLATSVALLVQIYSVAFMRGDPRYPSYTALVLLFTAAMSLVVAADDLFVLLVGWEAMGACSWLLIAHYWEREPARAGAVKAFVMTRLGDVGLLFGIFELGRATGTYRISGVLSAVAAGRVSTTQATAAGLLLLCGVVGKSAQFPLHTWLPDAMPGPTPISALIHAATMVAAGVYLVARLLPLLELSALALNVLAVLSVVSLVGGACFALVAEDLKRVLAWSTVSQLAYMFAALSIGGYRAGVLHLLSHGAFKALLFLCAGSVIHCVGRQRLVELGGLRRPMPVTFVATTVGLAALAGIPPFGGFFSKDAVVAVAATEARSGSARAWLVLVAALVGSALTAAYAMRVWLLVFFGRPAELAGEVRESTRHEPSWWMTGPVVVLAAVTTVGGLAVLRPGFLGVPAAPFRPVVAVGTLVVALVGAAATYVAWSRLGGQDPALALGPARRLLVDELAVDAAVDASAVRGTRLASRVTAATEAQVVAPYVRGGEGLAQLVGRGLRRLHTGNVSGYLTAVVLGAVAVALLVGLAQ